MKISAQQYAKALLELTDGKSEQEVFAIVARFAETLKKDGQVKNVGKIMEKFSQLYDREHGIVSAEVTSSMELGKEAIAEIEGYIKRKYDGNTVEIKSRVDKGIKGGIMIRVGDEVIDGSVVKQLERLRKELVK